MAPILTLVRPCNAVFTMIQSLGPNGGLVPSAIGSRRHGWTHYARDREGRTPFRRLDEGWWQEDAGLSRRSC